MCICICIMYVLLAQRGRPAPRGDDAMRRLRREARGEK